MDLFEQKFVELNYTDNRPSHNGDAAKECEKLIRAEESKGWQAGQVLIPLNETMCAGGVLGCQVMLSCAAARGCAGVWSRRCPGFRDSGSCWGPPRRPWQKSTTVTVTA